MLNSTQMTQIEPDLRHLRAILYLFQNPYQ